MKPRLGRPWLRALLVLLALVTLALVLLLATGSAPVLRLATGLPWQGSLWTGLRLPAADGVQDGWRWRLQGLQLAPLRRQDGLWQLGLHIEALQLDRPGPAPATPPPTLAALQALLADLARAPALRLQASVPRLDLQGQRVEGLQFALESRAPGLALQRATLRWQGATLEGEARLNPQAQLSARLAAQRDTLRLALQAEGRLDALALQATLSEGEGAGAARWLDAEARLDALAPQPLRALQARWQALDPQRLHPSLPAGQWQGQASWAPLSTQATTPDPRLRVELDTDNRAARRLDEGGWPLRRLQLRALLDPAQWQALELQALLLELGSARQGAGRLELAAPQRLPRAGEPLQTQLRLVGLQPQQLNAGWPAAAIDGQLALRSSATGADTLASAPLHWQLALSSPATRWRLRGEGSLQGRQLSVQELLLADGEGRLRLSGEAEALAAGWRARVEAEAQALRAPLPPGSSPSLLNGTLRGAWHDGGPQRGARHQGELQLTLAPGSRLAGLPLTGSARWAPGASSAPWQIQLDGEGFTLAAQGDPGEPLQSLERLRHAAHWRPQQARWQVAELAALAPLWQPWLQQLAGRSEGRWQAEGQTLQAEFDALRVQPRPAAGGGAAAPATRLQRAELQWQGGAGQLSAQGLQHQGLLLRTLSAGFGLQAPLHWQASGEWQGAAGAPATAWHSRGRSGAAPRGDDGLLRWPELQLEFGPNDAAGAAPWLRLASPALTWDGAQQQLRLAPGSLQLAGEPLALQAAQWRDGAWQLALEGRVRLRPWLALVDRRAAWQGEASSQLRLRAEQREGDAAPQLDLRLAELQGALQLDGQPLELRALALQLRQQGDGSASLQAQLGSALLGELQADVQAGAGGGGELGGRLQLRLPRFTGLRPWLPLGLHAEGDAELQAQLGGTRAAPQLVGSASARLSSLRHAGSGFAAREGRLLAQFDLDRLQVRELSLLGAGDDGGRLLADGLLEWKDGLPRVRLQASAERLRVLGRFDRRLTLSGQSRLELDGRRLQLQGQLRADEGFFEVGRPEAPTLDDDVRVADDSAPPPEPGLASRWRREVDVQLDLGERLRVQGRGFASRLTGQLRLSESGGKPWQLNGLIETQGGRYKAYGQTLEIESGELRFAGSPTNPRLNLLAIKPDIEHRVGVSVTGSLEQPRVRLFAEPELSDNDKLAWLLLGRDPSELAARDTALLQRAALAVLAGEGESAVGRLMDSLGLTEFSVSQGEDAGTVLRLGARLSKRWSVGYERSLNATSGSWQLVYRIGQRLRLRAQSGVESAVDALWVWRFD